MVLCLIDCHCKSTVASRSANAGRVLSVPRTEHLIDQVGSKGRGDLCRREEPSDAQLEMLVLDQHVAFQPQLRGHTFLSPRMYSSCQPLPLFPGTLLQMILQPFPSLRSPHISSLNLPQERLRKVHHSQFRFLPMDQV